MKTLKKMFNNKVHWYDKYAYFRLCHTRGGVHLAILTSAYAKIPEFLILIKVFNIPFMLGIIIACLLCIIEIGLITLIGHTDLQNKLMAKDISLHNKYNPEIQKLLRK